MMEKEISIKDLFGTDIRTRMRARDLCPYFVAGMSLVLNFSGVSFVSRSFVDEVLTIAQEHADVQMLMTNQAEGVDSMFKAVEYSRANRQEIYAAGIKVPDNGLAF